MGHGSVKYCHYLIFHYLPITFWFRLFRPVKPGALLDWKFVACPGGLEEGYDLLLLVG